MSANAFLQKDYENEIALRPKKNKPNQTKSQNTTPKACPEPRLRDGWINHELLLKLI